MAAEALVGREMGRYLIQAVIGTGGFAVVYRAVDTVLERTVALKVLDPASHRDPTIGRRFVLEGRAAASLDHPAIVPVYDAGEHDGVLWMAMRLVEGSTLDQALGAGRRLPPDEVIAVVERIGSALDHAHERGVVHRDVKPSNLLLERDDPYRAHLADFGIAATARSVGRYTAGALGTAAYMAPEQARPSEVGPPADLYSLACVAYEMLAGRRLFPGDDYVALLYAHATEAVPPMGHPAVDAVLHRALAKAPAGRPTSGGALAHELRQALAPPPPPLPPPPPAEPPSPSPPAGRAGPRRGRWRLVPGAVVLVVAVGAGTVALLDRRSSAPRRVDDTAGISYDLRPGWDLGRVEPPLTTLVRDGDTEVVTLTHRPAGTTDAVAALADADPAVCQRAPVAYDGLDSGAAAARCDNPQGAEPATAVGVVAGDDFWLITVAPGVAADDRDAFLASVRFG
ncbi:MAG TPA: serine/threonine-protein kinase [Acidimicrobiales bacterium]|nr:serine/threonine-protein kinase [Acidimicrobiales bacterium]